jgi:hypothetical protein
MNKQKTEKFSDAIRWLEEALDAMLIIDHTSYHTGEIIVLRRLLKDWK